MLKFLQKLALDFHIFVCNFSREIFTDNCIENFKKTFEVLGLLAHVTPSNFFSRILKSEALVYSPYIF